MSASLDIVVPAHNEAATIAALVARLRAACPAARIIVVDNASTDGTAALVDGHAGVTLVRHERNLGYGRSLADGIAAGTGALVVMIDADLEYQPEDVPAVVRALDGSAAVFGSRFLDPRLIGSGRSGVWAVGNRLVTGAFNLLFGQAMTDLYTGLRGVRRAALAGCRLESPGFEFVLELAARLARAGVHIAEVPVRYLPRTVGHSKMRHVPELARFVRRLVALRLEAR